LKLPIRLHITYIFTNIYSLFATYEITTSAT